MARILVVEDEAPLRSAIRQSLGLDGHDAHEAGSLREAFALLGGQPEFDAIVTDLTLVGESGMDLIRRVRALGFDGLIVVVTAHGTIESAIEALKIGADEFVQKPLRLDELGVIVARGLEHRRLKGQLDLHRRLERVASGEGDIPCTSGKWVEAVSLAERFASLPVPAEGESGELPTILLLGETGTGKGVLARQIHTMSQRGRPAGDARPFVHVNCAALPPSLFESELFGHEKGAFTDARSARAGLFELAEGGTIFLDEIGEVALEMQAKLLLVMERGVFRRIGGGAERRVRARVVAATNQHLEARAAAGSFRSDLLFRLNALTIRIPPLRERRGDALILAEAMLRRAAEQYGRGGMELSREARELIDAHPWPGNVRELSNAVRRAAILCDSRVVEPHHLGIGRSEAGAAAGASSADPFSRVGLGGEDFDFSNGPVTLESLERRLIIQALRHAHGNVSRAARLIGLNRGALRYRIDRLGLGDQVRGETVPP